eukprot:3446815-Pleurochrysis_carterae.AAC.5
MASQLSLVTLSTRGRGAVVLERPYAGWRPVSSVAIKLARQAQAPSATIASAALKRSRRRGRYDISLLRTE